MLYSIQELIVLFISSLFVGGKEAMINGPAAFNAVASEHYKAMDEEGKKLLGNDISESVKTMTVRNIKHGGLKLFRRIESQVFKKVARNYISE